MKDALARAAAWLVEPSTPGEDAPTSPNLVAYSHTNWTHDAETTAPLREARVGPMELRARPMELRLVEPKPVVRPFVAVVGLAPGCGATTLARALAATFARRDHSGTAIVASADEPVGSGLSVRAASRLAARVNARATGRLCLTRTAGLDSIRRMAPVVVDVPASARAPQPDVTVLVAPGEAEPALAELAARTLNALTVVTKADDLIKWDGRALLVLPHSRLGARLANAGWEPHGGLGAAVALIADACEERACTA